MAITDRFRQQHTDLAEAVRKIEAMLDPSTLAAHATAVTPLIASLLGKLSMHLAMEDNSLYPRLKSHANPELARMAGVFMEEMSRTKPVVEEYGRRWTATTIVGDPAKFCAESRTLFAALADRIKRENTQLYALADRTV